MTDKEEKKEEKTEETSNWNIFFIGAGLITAFALGAVLIPGFPLGNLSPDKSFILWLTSVAVFAFISAYVSKVVKV